MCSFKDETEQSREFESEDFSTDGSTMIWKLVKRLSIMRKKISSHNLQRFVTQLKRWVKRDQRVRWLLNVHLMKPHLVVNRLLIGFAQNLYWCRHSVIEIRKRVPTIFLDETKETINPTWVYCEKRLCELSLWNYCWRNKANHTRQENLNINWRDNWSHR